MRTQSCCFFVSSISLIILNFNWNIFTVRLQSVSGLIIQQTPYLVIAAYSYSQCLPFRHTVRASRLHCYLKVHNFIQVWTLTVLSKDVNFPLLNPCIFRFAFMPIEQQCSTFWGKTHALHQSSNPTFLRPPKHVS